MTRTQATTVAMVRASVLRHLEDRMAVNSRQNRSLVCRHCASHPNARHGCPRPRVPSALPSALANNNSGQGRRWPVVSQVHYRTGRKVASFQGLAALPSPAIPDSQEVVVRRAPGYTRSRPKVDWLKGIVGLLRGDAASSLLTCLCHSLGRCEARAETASGATLDSLVLCT